MESDLTVRDQLADLARDMKSLRLEWEETYESVNRALRKLAKREKRSEADCGCTGTGQSEDGGDRSSSNGSVNWLARARQQYGDPWRAR